MAADAKIDKAKQVITRQTKIISRTTKDLMDTNLELEKTHLQNMSFRQAMEQDPAKTADMDNALDLLKRDLSKAEERAVQIEEDFIQLEKRKNLECLEKDAEITALAAENRILHTALEGALASKKTEQTALRSCFEQLKSGKDEDSLKAALEMYCSVVEQDDQLHAKISEMKQMHTHAVQRNKDLQLRCNKLEDSAQETLVKVLDLESALQEKSDNVFMMQIEADAKQREYETSLSQRDTALATTKNEADQSLNTLKALKDAGADSCTSCWIKYQEMRMEQAAIELQTSENRVKDLEQKLSSTENHCTQLYTQDYSEYPELLADARDEIDSLRKQVVLFEQQGGSIQYMQKLAASQDEIKDLQKKLEESDCRYASRDYVKWSDHMSRVNEVQTQTQSRVESQIRQDLEVQVTQDVTKRWGKEYVVPLMELGRHFWARIGRLERTLSGCGINTNDNERETLLKASMFMQIDTSGGVRLHKSPWN